MAATYDVMYVGQLRFVECIEFHKDILKNAKNIYGVFCKDIQDIYKINIGSSYSAKDSKLNFEGAVEYFINNVKTQDITIVENEIYKDIFNIDSLEYFTARRFLLLANYIRETDSDFTVILSTDSLINPDNLQRCLDKSKEFKDPYIFVNSFASDHDKEKLLFNTNFSYINQTGRVNFKKYWKESSLKFLSTEQRHPLKVETTWSLFTELCHVKNKNLPYQIPVNAFRPNMNLRLISHDNPVDNYVQVKQGEWRTYKDNFCKNRLTGYKWKTTTTYFPYPDTVSKNMSTWCYNAFHALSMDNAGGSRPCCMYTGRLGELPIGQSTLLENFNSKTIIRIRNELESGIKSRECNKCWQEEEGGRKSKRLRDNQTYTRRVKQNNEEANGLQYLELNLGNHCNIRCRTCAPYASSQWLKEDYEVNWSNLSFTEYSEKFKKFSSSFADESPFWPDLKKNLSTIQRLDFYGGEPFLSKKMWNVLEYADSQGYAKNIELHYATNGTIFKDNFKDIFRNFREVNIMFSIDGVQDSFEYMRYLADWDTVFSNMQKMQNLVLDLPNINPSWCITLSTLNIFSLPEILTEHQNSFKNFGCYLNLVHNPTHFNISYMPNIYKPTVISRLDHAITLFPKFAEQIEGIKGFILNGKEDLELWEKFLDTVKKHDRYRQQNYAETFPFFAKIIGYNL